MTCVYCRDKARFDWLILEHYSPVIPTGLSQVKSHIIKKLLTSNVLPVENLKPPHCRIGQYTIARSLRQGLGRFGRIRVLSITW